MKIKDVQILLKPAEISETGMVGSAEIEIKMTFFGSPQEAHDLGELMASGGSYPPAEFWRALDWGQVDAPDTKPLTAEEASDIRLAEARAPWSNRMQALYDVCQRVAADRRKDPFDVI